MLDVIQDLQQISDSDHTSEQLLSEVLLNCLKLLRNLCAGAHDNQLTIVWVASHERERERVHKLCLIWCAFSLLLLENFWKQLQIYYLLKKVTNKNSSFMITLIDISNILCRLWTAIVEENCYTVARQHMCRMWRGPTASVEFVLSQALLVSFSLCLFLSPISLNHFLLLCFVFTSSLPLYLQHPAEWAKQYQLCLYGAIHVHS